MANDPVNSLLAFASSSPKAPQDNSLLAFASSKPKSETSSLADFASGPVQQTVLDNPLMRYAEGLSETGDRITLTPWNSNNPYWIGPQPQGDITYNFKWKAYQRIQQLNAEGRRGFGETITDIGAHDLPFVGDVVSLGTLAMGSLRQIPKTIKALENNQPVSDDDLLDLNIYVLDGQRRAQQTWQGTAGDVIRQMPGFMAEMGIMAAAMGELGALIGTTGGPVSAAAGGLLGGIGGALGAIGKRIAGIGAKKVATKAVTKFLGEGIAKLGTRTAAKEGVAFLATRAATVGGAMALVDTAANALVNIATGAPAGETRLRVENQIGKAFEGKPIDTETLGALDSTWLSLGDKWIEYASEMTGPLFTKVLVAPALKGLGKAAGFAVDITPGAAAKLNKLAEKAVAPNAEKFADIATGKGGFDTGVWLSQVLDKAWGTGGERIAALKARAAQAPTLLAEGKFIAGQAARLAGVIANTGVNPAVGLKMLENVGYNGWIEEMAEERVGGFFKGLMGIEGDEAGLKNAWDNMWPNIDQWKAEMVSFAVPLAAVVGATRGQVALSGQASKLIQSRNALIKSLSPVRGSPSISNVKDPEHVDSRQALEDAGLQMADDNNAPPNFARRAAIYGLNLIKFAATMEPRYLMYGTSTPVELLDALLNEAGLMSTASYWSASYNNYRNLLNTKDPIDAKATEEEIAAKNLDHRTKAIEFANKVANEVFRMSSKNAIIDDELVKLSGAFEGDPEGFYTALKKYHDAAETKKKGSSLLRKVAIDDGREMLMWKSVDAETAVDGLTPEMRKAWASVLGAHGIALDAASIVEYEKDARLYLKTKVPTLGFSLDQVKAFAMGSNDPMAVRAMIAWGYEPMKKGALQHFQTQMGVLAKIMENWGAVEESYTDPADTDITYHIIPTGTKANGKSLYRIIKTNSATGKVVEDLSEFIGDGLELEGARSMLTDYAKQEQASSTVVLNVVPGRLRFKGTAMEIQSAGFVQKYKGNRTFTSKNVDELYKFMGEIGAIRSKTEKDMWEITPGGLNFGMDIFIAHQGGMVRTLAEERMEQLGNLFNMGDLLAVGNTRAYLENIKAVLEKLTHRTKSQESLFTLLQGDDLKEVPAKLILDAFLGWGFSDHRPYAQAFFDNRDLLAKTEGVDAFVDAWASLLGMSRETFMTGYRNPDLPSDYAIEPAALGTPVRTGAGVKGEAAKPAVKKEAEEKPAAKKEAEEKPEEKKPEEEEKPAEGKKAEEEEKPMVEGEQPPKPAEGKQIDLDLGNIFPDAEVFKAKPTKTSAPDQPEPPKDHQDGPGPQASIVDSADWYKSMFRASYDSLGRRGILSGLTNAEKGEVIIKDVYNIFGRPMGITLDDIRKFLATGEAVVRPTIDQIDTNTEKEADETIEKEDYADSDKRIADTLEKHRGLFVMILRHYVGQDVAEHIAWRGLNKLRGTGYLRTEEAYNKWLKSVIDPEKNPEVSEVREAFRFVPYHLALRIAYDMSTIEPRTLAHVDQEVNDKGVVKSFKLITQKDYFVDIQLRNTENRFIQALQSWRSDGTVKEKAKELRAKLGSDKPSDRLSALAEITGSTDMWPSVLDSPKDSDTRMTFNRFVGVLSSTLYSLSTGKLDKTQAEEIATTMFSKPFTITRVIEAKDVGVKQADIGKTEVKHFDYSAYQTLLQYVLSRTSELPIWGRATESRATIPGFWYGNAVTKAVQNKGGRLIYLTGIHSYERGTDAQGRPSIVRENSLDAADIPPDEVANAAENNIIRASWNLAKPGGKWLWVFPVGDKSQLVGVEVDKTKGLTFEEDYERVSKLYLEEIMQPPEAWTPKAVMKRTRLITSGGKKLLTDMGKEGVSGNSRVLRLKGEALNGAMYVVPKTSVKLNVSRGRNDDSFTWKSNVMAVVKSTTGQLVTVVYKGLAHLTDKTFGAPENADTAEAKLIKAVQDDGFDMVTDEGGFKLGGELGTGTYNYTIDGVKYVGQLVEVPWESYDETSNLEDIEIRPHDRRTPTPVIYDSLSLPNNEQVWRTYIEYTSEVARQARESGKLDVADSLMERLAVIKQLLDQGISENYLPLQSLLQRLKVSKLKNLLWPVSHATYNLVMPSLGVDDAYLWNYSADRPWAGVRLNIRGRGIRYGAYLTQDDFNTYFSGDRARLESVLLEAATGSVAARQTLLSALKDSRGQSLPDSVSFYDLKLSNGRLDNEALLSNVPDPSKGVLYLGGTLMFSHRTPGGPSAHTMGRLTAPVTWFKTKSGRFVAGSQNYIKMHKDTEVVKGVDADGDKETDVVFYLDKEGLPIDEKNATTDEERIQAKSNKLLSVIFEGYRATALEHRQVAINTKRYDKMPLYQPDGSTSNLDELRGGKLFTDFRKWMSFVLGRGITQGSTNTRSYIVAAYRTFLMLMRLGKASYGAHTAPRLEKKTAALLKPAPMVFNTGVPGVTISVLRNENHSVESDRILQKGAADDVNITIDDVGNPTTRFLGLNRVLSGLRMIMAGGQTFTTDADYDEFAKKFAAWSTLPLVQRYVSWKESQRRSDSPQRYQRFADFRNQMITEKIGTAEELLALEWLNELSTEIVSRGSLAWISFRPPKNTAEYRMKLRNMAGTAGTHLIGVNQNLYSVAGTVLDTLRELVFNPNSDPLQTVLGDRVIRLQEQQFPTKFSLGGKGTSLGQARLLSFSTRLKKAAFIEAILDQAGPDFTNWLKAIPKIFGTTKKHLNNYAFASVAIDLIRKLRDKTGLSTEANLVLNRLLKTISLSNRRTIESLYRSGNVTDDELRQFQKGFEDLQGVTDIEIEYNGKKTTVDGRFILPILAYYAANEWGAELGTMGGNYMSYFPASYHKAVEASQQKVLKDWNANAEAWTPSTYDYVKFSQRSEKAGGWAFLKQALEYVPRALATAGAKAEDYIPSGEVASVPESDVDGEVSGVIVSGDEGIEEVRPAELKEQKAVLTLAAVAQAPQAPIVVKYKNVPMSYQYGPGGKTRDVSALRQDLRARYPQGASTAELMNAGIRTATTRGSFGAKVGDYLTFGNGVQGVWRVVAIEHPDLKTPEGRALWESREGWSLDFIEKDPGLRSQVFKSTALQYVFERITPATQVPAPAQAPQVPAPAPAPEEPAPAPEEPAPAPQAPVPQAPAPAVVVIPEGAETFVTAGGRVGVLSQGQAEALKLAEPMRDPDNKALTLRILGPAGTGKSTIVKELMRRWRYKYGQGGVILASPTHRANWVLRMMSMYKTRRWGMDTVNKEEPVTLEKLMGAKPDKYTGKFTYPEITAAQNMRNPPPITDIGRGSVLIVDESSMIDAQELKKLQEWQQENGFSLILLGDAEQLPPVGMDKSPVFEAKIPEVKLTEVMRQRGGNPLLDFLTDLRTKGAAKMVASLNTDTGEGLVLVNKKDTAIAAIRQLFSATIARANMSQLRVLAARNSVVRQWNEAIHRALYPDATAPIVAGEVVIGYRNTKKVMNGLEYFVSSVSQESSLSSHGFSFRGWRVEIKEGSEPEKEGKTVLLVSKADEPKYVAKVREMGAARDAAWKAWRDGGKAGHLAKKAGALTDAFDEFTADVGIMNDVDREGNVRNLEETSPSLIRRIFDLGYASTVHKAQGGTVNIVVVDFDDLKSFPGSPAFLRQLLYTAMSRASKTAMVVSEHATTTSEPELNGLVSIGTKPSFYEMTPPDLKTEESDLYGMGKVPKAGEGYVEERVRKTATGVEYEVLQEYSRYSRRIRYFGFDYIVSNNKKGEITHVDAQYGEGVEYAAALKEALNAERETTAVETTSGGQEGAPETGDNPSASIVNQEATLDLSDIETRVGGEVGRVPQASIINYGDRRQVAESLGLMPEQNVTSRAIIDRAIQSLSGVGPATQELLSAIINYSRRTNTRLPEIIGRPHITESDGRAAAFLPNRGSPRIEVYSDGLENTQLTAKYITHELVHWLTHYALQLNPKIKAKFTALLDEARRNAGWIGDDETTHLYGLKDEWELIAEAFSSPKFQKFLADIPSTEEAGEDPTAISNLWRRFVDAIRGAVRAVLGPDSPSDSMLDQVIRETLAIIPVVEVPMGGEEEEEIPPMASLVRNRLVSDTAYTTAVKLYGRIEPGTEVPPQHRNYIKRFNATWRPRVEAVLDQSDPAVQDRMAEALRHPVLRDKVKKFLEQKRKDAEPKQLELDIPQASIVVSDVDANGKVGLQFSWHQKLLAIPDRIRKQQSLAQQLQRVQAPKDEAAAFLKWADGKTGEPATLLEQYEAEVLPKLYIRTNTAKTLPKFFKVYGVGSYQRLANGTWVFNPADAAQPRRPADLAEVDAAYTSGHPTAFYEQLSVNQGAGDYRETVILTPFPVPGQHGQFSNPRLLGWFRSREYTGAGGERETRNALAQINRRLEVQGEAGETFDPEDLETKSALEKQLRDQTMAGVLEVQEVQSTALQYLKMFDWTDHAKTVAAIDDAIKTAKTLATKSKLEELRRLVAAKTEEYGESWMWRDSNEARFMNLLAKDQTWVPVFVNAITQWARNQGFAKVRFPTGETAARVEGHQVLADRLGTLQAEREAAAKRSPSEDDMTLAQLREQYREERAEAGENEDFPPLRVWLAENAPDAGLTRSLADIDAEINELKTQGIEKLAPIEAFYEKRVAAIVNRMGAQPVTDANGNTWREVSTAPQASTVPQASLVFIDAMHNDEVFRKRYENAYIHHTSLPDAEFLKSFNTVKEQPVFQEMSDKPKGFWFSVGAAWNEWEQNNWKERLQKELSEWELKIPIGLKILKITTDEEFIAFEKKYRVLGPDHFAYDLVPYTLRPLAKIGRVIDWPSVAEKYDGVMIAPYFWHFNEHPWYYGWDAASGAIWNLDGVTVDKISVPNVIAPQYREALESAAVPETSLATTPEASLIKAREVWAHGLGLSDEQALNFHTALEPVKPVATQLEPSVPSNPLDPVIERELVQGLLGPDVQVPPGLLNNDPQLQASLVSAKTFYDDMISPIRGRGVPGLQGSLLSSTNWLQAIQGMTMAFHNYSPGYWGLDDFGGHIRPVKDYEFEERQKDSMKKTGAKVIRQRLERIAGGFASQGKLTEKERTYIRAVHNAAIAAVEELAGTGDNYELAWRGDGKQHQGAVLLMNPAFDPWSEDAENYLPLEVLNRLKAMGKDSATAAYKLRQVIEDKQGNQYLGKETWSVPVQWLREWWPKSEPYAKLTKANRRATSTSQELYDLWSSIDPVDLSKALHETLKLIHKDVLLHSASLGRDYLPYREGYIPHYRKWGFIGTEDKAARQAIEEQVKDAISKGNEAKLLKEFVGIEEYANKYTARKGKLPELTDNMLRTMWRLLKIKYPGFKQAAADLKEGSKELRDLGIVNTNLNFMDVVRIIHDELMDAQVARQLTKQAVGDIDKESLQLLGITGKLLNRYQDREYSARTRQRRYATNKEAFLRSGLLPAESLASEIVHRYTSDIAGVTVSKVALNNMVIQTDIDGRPLVIPMPDADVPMEDSILLPETWETIARKVSDYFGKPLDPNKEIREALRDIISKLQLHKDEGTYTRVKSPYTSIEEFLAYKRPGGAENLLDMAVGGEVAGYLKHIVGEEWDPIWHGVHWMRGIMHVNNWSKLLSLGVSGFFAVAGLESVQSLTNGSLWNAKTWGARDRLSLREIRRMYKANDPWLASVLYTMRDLGIELSDVHNMFDTPLGLYETDIVGLGDYVEKKMGRVAGNRARRVLSLPKAQSDIMFGTVFNTIKIYTTLWHMQRLYDKAEKEGRGESFNLREEMAPWVNVINDSVGGQNANKYSYLTPGMRQFWNLSLFSWNWTLSAWNQAGGGVLTGPLFKNYMTPDQAAYVFGKMWPATLFHVLFAMPFLMQLSTWLLFSLPDPDDDRTKWDKPFIWQNERTRNDLFQWYTDITPLMRWSPFYEGTPTGDRRVYIRFGKQYQEIFRWFEDPIQNFLSKQSQFARMAFELATGRSPGSEWDLPFKNEGLLGWFTTREQGFMGSRLGAIVQKALPFSVLAWARNPEGFPLQFIGPLSKGISMTKATQMAEEVLRVWAYQKDDIDKLGAKAKKNLEALVPDILNAAAANGYDPKKVLNSARGVILKDLYTEFYRALESNDSKQLDAVGRRIIRLNGTVDNIRRSVSNRDNMYGKVGERSPEQMAMIREALGQ